MMTHATELSLLLQYAERADRQITDNLISFIESLREEARDQYEDAPDNDQRLLIQGKGRALRDLLTLFEEARKIVKQSKEQAPKDKAGEPGTLGRPVL